MLWGFLLLVQLVASCGTKSQENENGSSSSPNIILIMADDLGMETLGTYGGESYHTPNLDQLAATGMKFMNCYSTPLCTPSRVQIMTGKYNHRNYLAFGLLDAAERTFGHALQDAGYQTAIAGKWQLFGNERQQELAGGRTGNLPQSAGFHSYRLWQIKDRGWRYKSPTLETSSQGLVTYEQEYGPDKLVEFIEDFMEQNQHEPFFVYYPMVLVHDPFLPTPDTPGFDHYEPETRVNDTTYFGDMMTYMDKVVGRIVKKVDDLGIRDNTVIIFTGDNGTDRDVISSWKGQQIQGQKGYTVEAGTHVPLIVNWPGTVDAGQVNENLVDFTDFYPTLLDLAGVQPQGSKLLDGQSFYPQLLGDHSKTRDWVFCHYAPNWGKFPKKTYVQNTELKLYADSTIFQIKQDPSEQNPLEIHQLSPEQQSVIQGFRKVLMEMAASEGSS
jgi:arylsulfatase A-like enzyme